MPLGPFGEVQGTTGTLEGLGDAVTNYKSKVVAPRNPKLIKGEPTEFKIKPSQFIFQMSMNTEQKLANMHKMNVPRKIKLLDMSETSHQKMSSVNIDEPMFQPFPSEIIFQNFVPYETYEIPLLLRNNDKVPRLVKVIQESSPYFKIISPNNVGHKVGPGLPTTFVVRFTPEDNKDYSNELVCITEREKFLIPVKAIGSRAILDFPDEVNFSVSPVKLLKTKTLLVRNIGNRVAKFTVETSAPFYVSTSACTLEVNDSLQFDVEYKPICTGDHQSQLIVHYDTGEKVFTDLFGVAQDANVRLNKNSIRIEGTYISMANQRSVTITNRNDFIAHFKWSKFATHEEEEQEKIMFVSGLDAEEKVERDRFLEECLQDPTLQDKMSILTRTFQNRRNLAKSSDLLFEDDIILIDPLEGDIWPNSTIDVQVIFKPTEATEYDRLAFCDITGRESRLPLKIKGDGIGPRVQLSFSTLDMGKIFVRSNHTYEVVLANKGDIDAIFTVVVPSSSFGSKFTFNPSEGIVMPGGHQAILISFSSSLLGEFDEQFYFQIDGSPDKLPLRFRGSVIGPTFHFDVPSLKFGSVAYGFPSVQHCTLTNTALVPMTFTLRVPHDEELSAFTTMTTEDSASYVSDAARIPEDFTSTVSEAGSSGLARPLSSARRTAEFELTPSSGTLQPQSSLPLSVSLCARQLKQYRTQLAVDVEGVGRDIITVPMSAECRAPCITVTTPILDYGRCFLRYPFEHQVQLLNETDLPARYEIVPQREVFSASLTYSSPQPKGVVEARSKLAVPIIVTAQDLEELETTCFINIVGTSQPPLAVQLVCFGEGPVIHVTPREIDFRQIPVLTETTQNVRLSNESLIPAKFKAHMLRQNSVWQVYPSSGEILPEETFELRVVAYLDDCVRFHDKLQIEFLNGVARSIPVTAYGHGTTIVTDPPMVPSVKLGPFFSSNVLRRTFTLTNRGRRHQSLVWTTEGFSFTNKRALPPVKSKDVRLQSLPVQAEPPKPVFRLTPHRMELNPGESINMQMEAYVDSPQHVKEKLNCHAIIGRAGGKELIMKVACSCEFITPLMEFSRRSVNFEVNKKINDELVPLTERLLMTNVSSLPLTLNLELDYPFSLFDSYYNAVIPLGIGKSHDLEIKFDPAYRADSHSRKTEQSLVIYYEEHPHQDEVRLTGEVYFPNLRFEKEEIDFGCILNDTEVTRYLSMVNESPLDVHYRWSFLLDGTPVTTNHQMGTADIEVDQASDCSDRAPATANPRTVDVDIISLNDSTNDQPQKDLSEDEKSDAGESEKKDEEKPVEDLEQQPTSDSFVIPTLDITELDADDKKDACPNSSCRDANLTARSGVETINPALTSLLSHRSEKAVGVEEIFDILPLYGTLHPGETEQTTFTFFGHAHCSSRVTAVCEVEGGPTYKINLRGEASLVSYAFNSLEVDFGKQPFDQVASAELVLTNTGLVEFTYVSLGMDPGMANHPQAGVPVVIPHTGSIPAGEQRTLTVRFLPGVPITFHKSFQLQVAHFEPDTINLLGEGVFPRISLDLPRSLAGDDHYKSLVKEARENLVTETKKTQGHEGQIEVVGQERDDLNIAQEAEPSEMQIQREIERIVMQEFAQAQLDVSAQPDVLNLESESTRESLIRQSKKPKVRARLPDYSLDFGHTVLSTVQTRTVRVTNTGWFSTSFSIDHSFCQSYGFHVTRDRVRNLPGAPHHETIEFVVTFDPRGANLELGPVDTMIPINIVGGPQICIRVSANVTMPDMRISSDVLQFDAVKCGECKVITVQLHNHKEVYCEWNSLPIDSQKKHFDKHTPLHLRRKHRPDKTRQRTFEMMPPVGVLMPGQRQNVQVKFMPTEEKSYEQRICVRLSQSSQRIVLLCRGQGQEPQIEFEHHLVEFNPILPHSVGDEKEVCVKNPCAFPVEIYSLEFDKSYLQEEKILRLMKGYDEHGTILLPPRPPGEKLPKELLDHFDEQVKKLEEAEKARKEAEEAKAALEKEVPASTEIVVEKVDGEEKTELKPLVSADTKQQTSDSAKPDSDLEGKKEAEVKEADGMQEVGDLEITPVSASIARHLGIDLTPEGKAARNRRGIALVVNGTPKSGKSSLAATLAERYGTVLLTIDSIITSAIAQGNTPMALKAREACQEAGQKWAEEHRVVENEESPEKKPGGLSVEALTAHTQGSAMVQVTAAQSVVQSLVSNRKTSTVSDQRSKLDKGLKHPPPPVAVSNTEASGAAAALTGTSSPQPLSSPISQSLSVSGYELGDMRSTVLPEDVIVELLAERLMANDCHKGVVFDSLDTMFCQNIVSAAHCVLRALNNRKYMFFVTLKQEFTALKEREQAEIERNERLAREKEEKDRQLLEEMSEDEYDNMSDEQKAEVDMKRLAIKKERLKKDLEEKAERERIEREAWEAEQKRIEEERQSKKKHKKQDDKAKKGAPSGGKTGDSKSQDRLTALKSQDGRKQHDVDHIPVTKQPSVLDRPESHNTDPGDTSDEPSKKGKKNSKEGRQASGNNDQHGKEKGDKEKTDKEKGDKEKEIDEAAEKAKEAERLLMQKFRTYDFNQKDLYELLDYWERSTGVMRAPSPPIDAADGALDDDSKQHPPSGRRAKKDKKGGKEGKAAAAAAAAAALREQADSADGEEGGEGAAPSLSEEERREKRLEEGVGLPNIQINVSALPDLDPTLMTSWLTERLDAESKLPSVEEVLDGLGLGPRGPPIPPPASFSVVPYPVKRHAPPGAEAGHYMFVASSPDDPNVIIETAETDGADDTSTGAVEDTKRTTPTKAREGRGKDKLSAADLKQEKRKSSAKGARAGRRSSVQTVTPPLGGSAAAETDQNADSLEDRTPALNVFRWVIPAQSELTIRLRFTSDDVGQYDQTLNFELLGTRRRYQLYCRGICAFPTISREPRVVFSQRKKNKRPDEIVNKKYILSTETFEFGPLLVGKSRDRFKDGRYPENMEKLTILNTSPLDSDISFCYLNDSKSENYLLDPPTMFLKPGESQDLSIWAYPKAPGTYKDSLVCCVKENPEPIIFKLLTHGVRPELELDKKQLHFDKVLLHRKDTKKLYLRNSTMLPVAWKLNGLDNLGDDFSVSQESGVVEPRSEFALQAYFRAMKPVNTKKTIRIEVSDIDNVMGLVQTENIQVLAEAYDVALDMSFPKGTDGGIDFDVIRVLDEGKQQCSLKNKGKYEIKFAFSFEPTAECPQDVCDMFSVIQPSGALTPVDRPTQVQVLFRSTREVTIKEQPILRCQVIEPSIAENGETIASIPIKVSVRSVFSKYNIYPINDINFGSMLVNTKKSRSFVIENKGDKFEFKYAISKLQKQEIVPIKPKAEKRVKSREGSSSGRSGIRPKRVESIRNTRQDGGAATNQSRLSLGMFSIYPAFGFILPGGSQTITIDCTAEGPCKSEEDIAIDITGRDPLDSPQGIPYKLLAEACLPTINVTDFNSIFEEHRICKSLSLWQQSHYTDANGVFGEDENRFVFNNVLVGAKAQARFKINNTNKVPCDVLFSIKATGGKHSLKQQPDVFEVEPARAQIAPHSYIYSTVTFLPPSMQNFTATFEAVIDGLPAIYSKGRNLVFDFSGHGNLPRIAINKPSIRNKRGQPLLLFNRNLVGRFQDLPFIIVNEGNLPSKVHIDKADPDNAFTLIPDSDTDALMSEEGEGGVTRPHTASVIVAVAGRASFRVRYAPKTPVRSQATLHVTVLDNQYEDSLVQLVGEGFHSDVTLDNLHSVADNVQRATPDDQEGNMADDDVSAAKSNHINFGDCHVSESRSLTFNLVNHSATDCLRFVWPSDHSSLAFSPTVGHLHAGCAKAITLTFSAAAGVAPGGGEVEPRRLVEEVVRCHVVRVTFDRPISEVPDWDDRQRTVKWVEADQPPATTDSDKTVIAASTATPRHPRMRKITETEPEPVHSPFADTEPLPLELLVSANAAHARYECAVERVRFRDTMMLQTRVYSFTLTNSGSIGLDFSWHVMIDSCRSVTFRDPAHSPSPDADSPRRRTTHEDESPPRPATAADLAVRGGGGASRGGASRPTSACSTVLSGAAPEDGGYVPFSVEPEYGKVAPGESVNVQVRYSPLDVQEHLGRIICKIPNLDPELSAPVVELRARSLMPYAHFELSHCDYVSAARRNPELRGPHGAAPGTALDPRTRCVEFGAVGLRMCERRVFSVVNPTRDAYDFRWTNCDEPNARRTPSFTCVTPNGRILPGKKTEMVFEFLSNSLDLVESFWNFTLIDYDISVPFLLVGETKEPNVILDRSHLNFKSLLIGHEAVETFYITNLETSPFHFSFVDSSLHSSGYQTSLKVEPQSGCIEPNSHQPIQIRFTPATEKEVNFNVVCRVRNKNTPLTLNVKAEGYAMNCVVICEDSANSKTELSSSLSNEIDFRSVEINEKSIKNIYIVNSGKFTFDYDWTLKERSTVQNSKTVTIEPASGGVTFGERTKCQLSFCPTSPVLLKGCQLILNISNGPTYLINILGQSVSPGINFSFTSYDFGPRFIHRAGMPNNIATLTLTNRDKKDISVECLFNQTPHLFHDFDATVIEAGTSVPVNFTFLPREKTVYSENVFFEINGLSRRKVMIKGEGANMKIEVVDPKQKIVKFGALRINQSVKKNVTIANNSPTPLTFHVAATPANPYLQEKNILKTSPTSAITLAANGGQQKIEVCFSPKSRIPAFTEEVFLECAGLCQPLFVITGSCQGVEIGLDTEAIPFGAVVQKSFSTRKLVIANTGDIGSKFKWDPQKFAPDFSISPTDGYLSPGMEVACDVTFHPQEINQDIRYENLRCQIEAGRPLRLTLTGACASLPPPKETVHFSTHVRQRDTRSINIANRTNQHWCLRPRIDGEQWAGPVVWEVEPQQTRAYELTYSPLIMTADGKRHQGSVFFPLPDGTGLLYHVTGTAEAPKVSAKVTRDVPCKTGYTESLPVTNWLKKPQRFRVKFEMIKPDKLDHGTTLKGLDYIDVPGNIKRDYKINFYAHREGTTLVKVVFTNEQSGEYQFFELTFRALRPGVINTIDLHTPVRQSVPHTIRLDNPLSFAVTFAAQCNVPEILMPSQLAVPASSTGEFNLEYLPLRVGEGQGRLEFTCSELGLYAYELHMRATAAGPERALYFNTTLGANQVLSARFTNYAKQKTDYACKVDGVDFHVDKSVPAAPGSTAGTEVAVDVTYEPCRIGETRATLSVTSATGGDYSFPLFGRCAAPRPQGPFKVRAGSTTAIMFRNVFAHTTAFTFQVDNPLFHVAKTGDNVRARKDHRISVGFDGNDSGSKADVMAKLVVSCAKSAGGETNAQWVYYLRGVTPDK